MFSPHPPPGGPEGRAAVNFDEAIKRIDEARKRLTIATEQRAIFAMVVADLVCDQVDQKFIGHMAEKYAEAKKAEDEALQELRAAREAFAAASGA